jgi:hypothetical protein
MRKSMATLTLAAFVVLGLLYTSTTSLTHGYVHFIKTERTPHGGYHKDYIHTHTRHGSSSGTWNIPMLHAGVFHRIL